MTLALQDRYFPTARCFGCGPANTEGLQLKSHLEGDHAVARFTGQPLFDNGTGYLNGGIVATLLDCHGGAHVTHTAYANGWPALGDAALPFVTAGMDVRYLRPTPLRDEITLHSEMLEVAESTIVVRSWLEFGGKETATGLATWKRWRPRNSGTGVPA